MISKKGGGEKMIELDNIYPCSIFKHFFVSVFVVQKLFVSCFCFVLGEREIILTSGTLCTAIE